MMTKDKILTILFMMAFLMLGYGVAYSVFNSNTTISSSDQDIASFIFNAETTNQFQLSLNGLKPGDDIEESFLVSNNYAGKISDISVEYQMTIRTYHFIPVIIELYKIVNNEEELVLMCDETYIRNSANELVCDTSVQEMSYNDSKIDNYRLKIKFLNEDNDEIYANLVDYIDIKIESWQKLGD